MAAARRLNLRFAWVYLPVAAAYVVLVFFAPFTDVVDGDFSSHYGTLFDMASRPAGGPAFVGLVLLAALVVLLVTGSFWTRSGPLPIALALVGAVVIVMLVAKPGVGSPAPSLTAAGWTGLALAIVVITTALGHIVRLGRLRRTAAPVTV